MSSAPRIGGNLHPTFEAPRSILCPLTGAIMQEPVKNPHGHYFEKKAIEDHIKNPENKKSSELNQDLRFEDLTNQINRLMPKLQEQMRLYSAEVGKIEERQKNARLIDNLWSESHLKASAELVQLGAPAIEHLLRALKNLRYSQTKPITTSYIGDASIESGTGSIFYTLEELAKNESLLPALKLEIRVLIYELMAGRKLIQETSMTNTRERVISLGVKLGAITPERAITIRAALPK